MGRTCQRDIIELGCTATTMNVVTVDPTLQVRTAAILVFVDVGKL